MHMLEQKSQNIESEITKQLARLIRGGARKPARGSDDGHETDEIITLNQSKILSLSEIWSAKILR